jgi:hypothetical protein
MSNTNEGSISEGFGTPTSPFMKIKATIFSNNQNQERNKTIRISEVRFLCWFRQQKLENWRMALAKLKMK